jgi:hypothetical protein
VIKDIIIYKELIGHSLCEYVHAEIDWCELDIENLGEVTQYFLQARLATASTFAKSRAKRAA